MSPRTVTVDGAVFRIDQELTASTSGTAGVTRSEFDWAYVFGVPKTKTPVVLFEAATMNFSAAVTLVSGADAGVWQAGFAQNVTAIQRVATYRSGATIDFRVEHGPPMRDGEPGELPFSYDGTDLEPGVRADLTADDEPKLDLPTEVDGSPLTGIAGVEELVTWLSLARTAAPRKTVLLGRVTWRLNWSATSELAEFHFVTPTEVPYVVGAPVHDLHQELTAVALPALGDGRLVPDYREDASTNGYLLGRLTRPSQPIREWAFNDSDKPVAVFQHPLPPATWFAPEG